MSNKRALVIDTETTGSQVAALLVRHGLAVECLADGEQAWRRFIAWAPQLVVCAERLPGITGLQLCQMIRNLGSRSRILLLYSQPLAPAAETELCADLGCDAVLGHPLRLEGVVERLQQWSLIPPGPAVVGPPPGDLALPPLPVPVPVPVPSLAVNETPPPLSLPEHSPLPISSPPASAACVPALTVPRFGSLADLPLPRLLYLLYASRFFGVLELQRQGVRRAVYVWAGMPVRVDSEQLQDSLGVMLLEEGVIDEAALAQAKVRVVAEGVALGAALVAVGALSDRLLLEALRRQTERKLLSTLAWLDGTFVTREETHFAVDTILGEVDPLPIIWRGVRANVGVGPLMQYFSRLGARFVVATEVFALQWPAFRDLGADLELLPLLDGRHTFAAALVSDAGRTVELAQALYTLLVTDMICAAEVPGAPAAPVAEAHPPPHVQPIEYARLVAVSERIAGWYLRLKSGEIRGVLDLPVKASSNVVDDAFRQFASELSAAAETAGLSADDHRRLRELRVALPELRAALLDPRRAAAERLPVESPPDGLEQQRAARRRHRLQAEQAYREAAALMVSAPGEARRRAREAIELCPEEPAYLVALAQALRAGGAEPGERACELAEGALAEALRLDPAHLLANLEQARLLVELGRRAEARAAAQRVLQRVPHHPAAAALLADLNDDGGLALRRESGDHSRR